MNPIDPSTVAGVPAPIWFITFFKTLGFVLHSIPMHLWLAGPPLALVLLLIGGPNAKQLARRFFQQLPIIMAIGINFGIVPLLFVQVLYHKAFYPATILIAWHWFAIPILVLVAYYLVYATASLCREGRKWRPLLTGQIASILLIAVGLIFASAWTLMATPQIWPEIWKTTSFAGAATGLGTHWGDPAVYVRFLGLFGLAFFTVAVWSLFDGWFLYKSPKTGGGSGKKAPDNISNPSASGQKYSLNPPPSKPAKKEYKDFMDNPHLSRKEKKRLMKLRERGQLSVEEELAALETGPEEGEIAKPKKSRPAPPVDDDSYRRWVMKFAACTVWFGVILAGGFLWFYYYKILTPEQPNMEFLFRGTSKFLPPAVLGAIGLFAIVFTLGRFRRINGRSLVIALAGCEVLLLGLYATTRQLIQNGQLREYIDVTKIPTTVQWSPLLAFLGIFVLGAITIFWMVRAVVRATK